ncbi:MAG: radical SAM protein [Saprospirales bacterium]|nr:radical SAM protein [Saprospirales bacterium]
MEVKLRRLVIKPTLACTAGCPSCTLRLELYRQIQNENELSVAQWTDVLGDASQLGCRDLHVSGGEPALYHGLGHLVREATRLGMYTNMNTNGSKVTPELVRELAAAGLKSVTISLYSRIAGLNDRMRMEDGLFDRALRAIRYFRKYSQIQVDLQTILGGANLTDLDNYLHFAIRLGVSNVYLSFVEGQRGNPWLPSVEQIDRFRQAVLPRVRQVVLDHTPPPLLARTLKKVERMFPMDPQRKAGYAGGVYFPVEKPRCPKPYNFALILATGEVHPCNGVEYSHEPVMGNVLKTDLKAIWQNDAWRQFRKIRHDWCHQCPVVLHFHIPLN